MMPQAGEKMPKVAGHGRLMYAYVITSRYEFFTSRLLLHHFLMVNRTRTVFRSMPN